MKVLCIGESALERTSESEFNVVEGINLELSEFTEVGGGYAGNVAYLLSKWGIETYIASMLGSDEAGTKIKKEFEAIGTKTDLIETSFERQTSRTDIVINKNTRVNTIFDYPSHSTLKKYAFMVDPDIIFSDGTDYNATITAFDKYPKLLKVVGIKRLSKEALELAKFANYIIVNKRVAEAITNKKVDYNNSNTLVEIYNLIKQKYMKSEIIITLGERGCLYSVNASVKIIPPLNVQIIDNYGAGSVFTGAWIYGIGRGFDLEKSITFATIAASNSVTKITTRNSIPALTEVSNYYDSKFGIPASQSPQIEQTANMNTNPSGVATQTPNTEYQTVVNQNMQNQAMPQMQQSQVQQVQQPQPTGVANGNSQNS